jgi:hypothetical protein
MNKGALIFLAIMLPDFAYADCGALGRQAKEADGRLEVVMEQYKTAVAEVSRSSDRSRHYSDAISLNSKLLEAFNAEIALLEQGEAEGCFGKQYEAWKKTLEALRARRDEFGKERETLLKAAPVVDKDKNNKATAGKTSIEFMNDRLDAALKSMNEQAPIEIDSKTLLRTVRRTGNVITYNYEVKIDKSLWISSMQEQLVRGTIKNACDNENVRSLLGLGYEYRHVSTDPNGLLLANILVTAKKMRRVWRSTDSTLISFSHLSLAHARQRMGVTKVNNQIF